MNWTISTTPDAGRTWTHVEDFQGSQEDGLARVRVLQAEAPARYRLAPDEAAETGSGTAAPAQQPATAS